MNTSTVEGKLHVYILHIKPNAGPSKFIKGWINMELLSEPQSKYFQRHSFPLVCHKIKRSLDDEGVFMSTKRENGKPSFSTNIKSWNVTFSKLQGLATLKSGSVFLEKKSLHFFIILRVGISKTKHIWIQDMQHQLYDTI